jgi:hypothetical protein
MQLLRISPLERKLSENLHVRHSQGTWLKVKYMIRGANPCSRRQSYLLTNGFPSYDLEIREEDGSSFLLVVHIFVLALAIVRSILECGHCHYEWIQ